ncbi:formate dehydrogenase-N subunit alpha [Bosea minatitlanensis]
MLQELSRRQFMKAAGAGLGGSAVAALGFGGAEEALAQAVRPFKLTGTTETRNTCPYCSVACGVIMYSLGDKSKNAHQAIVHIEGDPDHPTNRGTLCPKGSALLDFIHSETRTTTPQYRGPGEKAFRPIGWNEALDRIARLMKDDRDKNFIRTNQDGVTVNRWLTTGFLAASATTNETAFLTYKVVRSSGILAFDNQARV